MTILAGVESDSLLPSMTICAKMLRTACPPGAPSVPRCCAPHAHQVHHLCQDAAHCMPTRCGRAHQVHRVSQSRPGPGPGSRPGRGPMGSRHRQAALAGRTATHAPGLRPSAATPSRAPGAALATGTRAIQRTARGRRRRRRRARCAAAGPAAPACAGRHETRMMNDSDEWRLGWRGGAPQSRASQAQREVGWGRGGRKKTGGCWLGQEGGKGGGGEQDPKPS